MLWQEPQNQTPFFVSDDVIDISFQINCTQLPLDHAYDLRQAIRTVLPWLENDCDTIGIHSIHVASSGNGWNRPDTNSSEILQLSRRTRLYIRAPSARYDDICRLSGKDLDIGGYPMQINGARKRLLTPSRTIFSRSVVGEDITDESQFSNWVVDQLQKNDITPRKLLCGLAHCIATPGENFQARSLLIADLKPEQSIKLQESGIGPGRSLGAGLFLAHKSLDPVGAEAIED